MKRFLTVALLGASLMVLPGCYAMDIDATALQPQVYMSVTSADARPDVVSDFETELTASWALFGLLKLSDPNVRDALEREIVRANGSGVTGLEIKTQQTVIDAVLTALTFNLYGQRTTIISGSVIR